MTYCENCGIEISFKRTKNNRWLPCNYYTGEPHTVDICKKNNANINTGIVLCPKCNKPCFVYRGILMDQKTLRKHECKQIDITNWEKRKKRMNLLNDNVH